MKKINKNNAIEAVAKNNGVSAAAVRREIEIAIGMGMNSPGAAARTFWDRYRNDGRAPTPEEFVAELVDLLES